MALPDVQRLLIIVLEKLLRDVLGREMQTFLVKGRRHWQQPFFGLSPNRAIFVRKAALL